MTNWRIAGLIFFYRNIEINESIVTVTKHMHKTTISNLSSLMSNSLPQQKAHHNFRQIQSLEIGINGVTKQLKALNHKASGPNKIPAKVLKESANEIPPQYTTSSNMYTPLGNFPKLGKQPLSLQFTKGNNSDPANYRPISLTCILCKVMEHCSY